MRNFCTLFALLFLFISCGSNQMVPTAKKTSNSITTLSFVDEQIIPYETTYMDTRVGGLSGIDYANGKWYVICDDRVSSRYYELDVQFTNQGIESYDIVGVTTLNDVTNTPFPSGMADPESMRITSSSNIIWSSEGNISRKINPFIRIADLTGNFKDSIDLPIRYTVEQEGIKGPRNNGVFESLSKDYRSDNFWTATELPLEEDGDVPTSSTANAPIRIALIDMKSKKLTKEFAYPLDKVARKGEIEINGVTEILSYDKDAFLILERSYARGYPDGGNDVKIYKVNTAQATDVRDISELSKAEYKAVKKELLLDFETIRNQFTNGVVDNIEGMTFGPNFANGNRSLVLVSDNNFNKNQLTQLILLEVQ